jgi:hypothetical protein
MTARMPIPAFHPLKKNTFVIHSQNLVLALANGYTAKKLSIFINSFVSRVPNATLFLFIDNIPDDWPKKFARSEEPRIRLVVYKVKNRYSWLLPHMVRFYVYYKFLHSAKMTGNAKDPVVLLCDLRDVAFQSSSFDVYNDSNLHFFTETAACRIRDLTFNDYVIRHCYGNSVADGWCGLSGINCGITIGRRSLVLKFLNILTTEMKNNWICQLRAPMDQAMYMYLMYTGHIGMVLPYKVESNEVSFVMNGYGVPRTMYSINEKNTELNLLGKPYAILHQYDCLPAVTEAVGKQFG